MKQGGASLGLEVKVKFLEEVTFSWEGDNEQSFQGQHSREEKSKDTANRKEGHLERLDMEREHSGLELNEGLCGVGVGSKMDSVTR